MLVVKVWGRKMAVLGWETIADIVGNLSLLVEEVIPFRPLHIVNPLLVIKSIF